MQGSILLSGATGLLGHYLLREVMRTGRGLAVVARGSRTASARQRIEDSLTRWEKIEGIALPRPVVLEGDLTKPGLGLTAAQLGWIAEHCDEAIHNAASLTFVADDPAGEPYRSNVAGTAHFLDVCRQAGIRTFHHVSTAYVCGLRTGRILESELNVGQVLGNDYERSKVQSEQMVRAADFLDSVTVYRPGIIIGDSRTGYTCTFHGFYVPLKIAHGLIHAVATGADFRVLQLVEQFGLTGQERKNFVPVDWVGAVIGRIVARPALHGATYHVTPRHRASLADMVDVMAEAIGRQWKEEQAQTKRYGLGDLEDALRTQMEVYRAYWRDDPEFDTANTTRALPELPCPQTDRPMLLRMCEYAIRANFGWPIPRSVPPEIDVARLLPTDWNGGPLPASRIGLHVTGPGGMDQELSAGRSRYGIGSDCPTHVYLNTHALRRILDGRMTWPQALAQGVLFIESSGHFEEAEILDSLGNAFGQVVPR